MTTEMARIIRCDHCAREAEPSEFGLPPTGWITLTKQAPTFTKPVEVCSDACAVAHLVEKTP